MTDVLSEIIRRYEADFPPREAPDHKLVRPKPGPYQMPDDDLALYQGAAWKTPMADLLAGASAYTPNYSKPYEYGTEMRGGWRPSATLNIMDPVRTETPDPSLKYGYAAAYRDSLHNPLVALGMAEPGRLGYAPNDNWLPWNSLGPGAYSKSSDNVYASDYQNHEERGRVLRHEAYHRGAAAVRKAFPDLASVIGGNADHQTMPYTDRRTGTKTDGELFRILPLSDSDRANQRAKAMEALAYELLRHKQRQGGY